MPKRYDMDPANQGIVDALKADKKDPSGPYVWITYAAVQSLATALERTGSDEPLALVHLAAIVGLVRRASVASVVYCLCRPDKLAHRAWQRHKRPSPTRC